MRTGVHLRQTLKRVAERTSTYPYKCWGFGEAIAMLGLVAASRVTDDDRYRRVVETSFDRWWAAIEGRLAFGDHITPGVSLLLLAREQARWMDAALALGGLFRRFPERGGVTIHRPDLDGWTSHVWVDCLYTDGPFLALLGLVTGESSWQDLACAHTLAYIDVLWDAPSSLFFHGYDTETGVANAVRWGRGNGWALLGLVDLLRFLRPDHPARSRLATVVRRQVNALATIQDAGGHWHTVLDHPETYLEHSIAAMMAWAIPQAVRLGLVPAAAMDVAARAFGAALAATDEAGNLWGVSAATPAGDLTTYAERSTGVFPWGQGPLLLALADRIAPDLLWKGLV